MGQPHHPDLGLWGGKCYIFLGQEKGQYDVDISQLLEVLLYKDILLTLYPKTENVMDRVSVFIT
jgi:hypothetical protein